MLYTHKDIVAQLARFIIEQHPRVPANLVEIVANAKEWLKDNEIRAPNVSIPEWHCYEATEKELYHLMINMCDQVPEIAKLNEWDDKEEGEGKSFTDLGALARNITNAVDREHDRTMSIKVKE